MQTSKAIMPTRQITAMVTVDRPSSEGGTACAAALVEAKTQPGGNVGAGVACTSTSTGCGRLAGPKEMGVTTGAAGTGAAAAGTEGVGETAVGLHKSPVGAAETPAAGADGDAAAGGAFVAASAGVGEGAADVAIASAALSANISA